MNDRLAAMAAMAAMVKDRELAELAARIEERRRAEAALEAAHAARRRAVGQAAPDAAHRAGADALWLRLNSRQIGAASQAAFAAAARVEDQRGPARRAFGRADVLARLAAEARRQS